MTGSPLLVAYPDGKDIRTSLRFTSHYNMPAPYAGNATVKQITSSMNATSFALTFHCRDCLHWSQNGTTGSVATSEGLLDFGYAQSLRAPGNPSCPQKLRLAQHEAHGTWTALLEDSAASEAYVNWRALAKHTVPSRCHINHMNNRNGTCSRVVR